MAWPTDELINETYWHSAITITKCDSRIPLDAYADFLLTVKSVAARSINLSVSKLNVVFLNLIILNVVAY